MPTATHLSVESGLSSEVNGSMMPRCVNTAKCHAVGSSIGNQRLRRARCDSPILVLRWEKEEDNLGIQPRGVTRECSDSLIGP